MADKPLLENTKALEDMVAAMQRQIPVAGPTASGIPQLQSQLGELATRMKELADLYRQGVAPGSLAAQTARQKVEQQQQTVAQQFGSLAKPYQQAFMPQMEVLQKEQVEKEELERRKKMNAELLRGQYALSNFVRAASEGHIGGAIGAIAGLGGAATQAVGGLAAVLVDLVQGAERERNEASRRGAATASPSLESTQQASERLAEAAEAIRRGEEQRQRGESRRDQLLAQARGMQGWDLTQDPTFWANRLAGLPGIGRMARAGVRAAGTPGQQAALEQAEASRAASMGGASAPQARAAGMEALNRFLEDWIRSKGGKPEQFRQNIMIPGVEAGITSNLGYQSELQVGALNAARQDVDTQIMRMQLEQLFRIKENLVTIGNNTNGLEDLRPQWVP